VSVIVHVVAVSQREAKDMAGNGYLHLTRKAAEEHLKEVKAPPTDPYYASQYKIWQVKVEEGRILGNL
jgi:hypothetical protein